MAKLEIKGKDPHQWYEQMDSFSSWRDMRNTGLRNAFLLRNPTTEKKDLPKGLRGKVKAGHCPKDDTDWLLGENKAYQRVVTLDVDGFVTYTYMEAKWVPKDDREQFTYLLCTHLTLHLFCIEPNYGDYIWDWSPGGAGGRVDGGAEETSHGGMDPLH